MINTWGKYAVLDTHTYRLPLISDHASWTFRAPTFRDEAAVARALTSLTSRPNRLDIVRYELAYTFKSTTIPSENSLDAEGNICDDPTSASFKPFLPAGSSPEAVLAALDKMPATLVDELWMQVSTVAPNWGAVKPVEAVNPAGE